MPSLANIGPFVPGATFQSFTNIFRQHPAILGRHTKVRVSHYEINFVPCKSHKLCPERGKGVWVRGRGINGFGLFTDIVTSVIKNDQLGALPLTTDPVELILCKIRRC